MKNLYSTAEKTNETPSDWIEKHFYVPDPRDPETGELLPAGPIRLAKYQKRIVNEALSKKPDGMLKYTTIVYSAPKKSGKSALSSAVALYMAHQNPNSFIACVANDGKQSTDRLYGPIYTTFRLHRQLGGIFGDVNPNRTEVILPNYTKIEAIPCDAAGEAGSQPLGVFLSEIWGFTTDKKRRVYTELTIPPTLYGRAIRWVETYAGYKGESELLEQLYDVAVLQGVPHPDFTDLTSDLSDNGNYVVFTNEKAGTFALWDHEPRLPWQTQGYYCIPLPKDKSELQVLTSVGWKPAEDVTIEDEICTRSVEGSIEYQKPTNIFTDSYSGSLYRVHTQRFTLEMTPNHRVFAQYIFHTRKYKQAREFPPLYEYRPAADASKVQHGVVPTQGMWIHDPLPDVGIEDMVFNADDFVELLAWYLTEGHVTKDTRNSLPYYNMFTISQDKSKNRDKYDKIRALLERMQLSYTPTEGGFRVFCSPLSRYFKDFGVSYQKFIPRYILERCSREQLRLFLDIYTMGDGTRSGNKWVLYTNSDQMRYDLMELIFKAGYNPKYYGSYSSDIVNGRKPILHIAVNNFDFVWCGYGKRSSWTKIDAPAGTRVWCPTLPNSNFYVMNKGTSFWTGNSQEQSALPPEEFSRLHRNLWVSPVSSFIQESWWDNCENPELPVLREGDPTPVVVGIDMAVSRDCAAIVAVTRDPFHPDNSAAVRAVRVFSPKDTNGIIDQEGDVAPVLREWAEKWNVICFVYDPREMAKLAQDLSREGLGWFDAFGQTSPRAIADKQLHDMIVHRQISWNPYTTEGNIGFKGDSQESLYKHITQAGATTKSDGYRLEKLSQKTKIDAAVALSMAAKKSMELAIDNMEFSKDRLLEKLSRGEITPDKFSELIRKANPKLERILKDGRQ